jgi:putative ABC transport system permease protein
MNFATLSARNLTRNKTRVFLTILGTAIAVMAFLVFRTVIWAFTVGEEFAHKDRIATRDRVSIIQRMPLNYVQKVKDVPGIAAVTWADWFGGQDPKDKSNFFAAIAIDHKSYLDVYPEIFVTPEALARFQGDRQGALIGDVLAKKFKVKEGDDVTLTSPIYPGTGEWKFHVSGIYQARDKTIDRSSFLLRWDYLNESLPPGSRRRDQVGWMLARIDDPSKSAEISKKVDAIFDVMDQQTLTMSEKAFQTSFLAGFSAVLTIIEIVSYVILGIMMLIVGNTIAMSARERTPEYGTLLAIGFTPAHIARFVVAESTIVAFIGGLAGLALGTLIIGGLGPSLEESSLAAMFPFFRLSAPTVAMGLGLSVVLGAVAGLIPAYRASKLNATEALRRVG